jgi:hypothetical protein
MEKFGRQQVALEEAGKPHCVKVQRNFGLTTAVYMWVDDDDHDDDQMIMIMVMVMCLIPMMMMIIIIITIINLLLLIMMLTMCFPQVGGVLAEPRRLDHAPGTGALQDRRSY